MNPTFRQGTRSRLARMEEKLDRILILTLLTHKEIVMSQTDDAIAKLTADVTTLTSVDKSAVALIGGIKDQIAAAVLAAQSSGATADQLKSLSDLSASIEASTAGLAAAVAANTPAGQTQSVPPPVAPPAAQPDPAPVAGS